MSSRRANLMAARGLTAVPVSRQADREKAEALALAEVEMHAASRRRKSEALRRLRLARESE